MTSTSTSENGRDAVLAKDLCAAYIEDLRRMSDGYRDVAQRATVLEEFQHNWRQIDALQTWAAENWQIDNGIRRICVNFVLKGWPVLSLLRNTDELEQWVEPALAAAESNNYAPLIVTAQLYGYRGLVHFKRGGERDYAIAIASFEVAIEKFEEAGDSKLRAQWMHQLALTQRNASQHTAALETFERAYEVARSIEDYCRQSAILSDWGNTKANLGYYFEALDDYLRSVTSEAVGDCNDDSLRADRFGYIGNARRNLGQFEEAQMAYQAAQIIDERSQNRQRQGNHYFNLALVFRDLGNLTEMAHYLREAQFIADKVGDKRARPKVQNALGTHSALIGDFALAIELHQGAVQLSKDSDLIKAYIQSDTAETFVLYGQYEKAQEYLTPALAVTKDSHTLLLQQRLYLQARIHAGKGDFEAALAAVLKGRAFDSAENTLVSRHKLAALHAVLLGRKQDPAALDIADIALRYCRDITGYSVPYVEAIAHGVLAVMGRDDALGASVAASQRAIEQFPALVIRQDTATQLHLLNADAVFAPVFAVISADSA